MKIQWLGTAASEGWPALFCQCAACKRAMQLGGKNIRTRSGALIDDALLIDLNPDLYAQKLLYNLDLADVTDILITHNHSDHFQPDTLEFLYGVYAHRDVPRTVRLYGPEDVIERSKMFEEHVEMHVVHAGDEFDTESHHITVLPAVHSAEMGKFYLVEKGEKSILYAHDTDSFGEEAMKILREHLRRPMNLCSLDCTNGPLPHIYIGHMGIAEDAQMKDQLIREGLADKSTRFICNHFSHNGQLMHDELCKAAAEYGMEVSYDGMIAEV